MDNPTFRSIYPEFASLTTYPDAQVNYYLAQAVTMLNASVWCSLQDQGVALYTAHNLTLAARRAKTALAGGTPGLAQGILASKAVDKVSMGFDTGSVAIEGAGAYNLTEYGLQFIKLARLVGAQGMIQTGGGYPGVNTGVFGDGFIN